MEKSPWLLVQGTCLILTSWLTYRNLSKNTMYYIIMINTQFSLGWHVHAVVSIVPSPCDVKFYPVWLLEPSCVKFA